MNDSQLSADARLTGFTHEKTGGMSRVVSEFDGMPFWFESKDLDLEPSIEALGTLWLIPCLLSNRNLKIEQPVCKTWYENAHAIMEFLNNNWGTPVVSIQAQTHETQPPIENSTAAFFSGGVDSFYTVQQGLPLQYLVNVEAFDYPASAAQHIQESRKRLLRVAEATGSTPISVATNINEHPSYKIHKIADTHASLLASVGHLLAPYAGSIKISPTFHHTYPLVFGSHYQLDPLWSSNRIQIVHAHADTRRRDRVAAIADWKIVQENLRVCFYSSSPQRNCSRCEKCVRTMMDLHILGKLEPFNVFDQSIPVWEAMESVFRVMHTDDYEHALECDLEPELELAIRRMIRRGYVHMCKMENDAGYKRHIDEEFPKLREALKNTLHHYSLLEENYENLLNDYKEVVENRPMKRGVRAFRHVMRMLRDKRRFQEHK